MSTGENLRRSSRIKALVKETPVRKKFDESSEEDEKPASSLSKIMMSEELKQVEEHIQKPIELFSDDDVSGQKLYGFETPVKKDAMTQKANQCRTPISTQLARLLPKPVVALEKIDLSKKNIYSAVTINQKRRTTGLTSSESESVSDSSEYMPSQDDTLEETSESESAQSSDEENGNVVKQKSRILTQKAVPHVKYPNTPKKTKGRYKSGIVHKDYHIKTDEYFETQLEKAVTSDRTLDRLRNSRLTKEKLEELLATQNDGMSRHKKNICSITESYTSLFPLWHFIMEEGFTVLLHGLGSKRCLINNFHKSVVSDHPTLIVNGFFPSLAIKDILDGIIVDLLGQSCPSNVSDCIELIERVMKKNPMDRLYLLIHNIDGIMLRSNKSQELLSCLASIPNICVLASIDHINAPLLWDHVKRSKFNFFWWDTTTFMPYQEETSYESSLLVQQSGALALSSLHNVFLSLTSNAKSIYVLLAENQLKNGSNVNFNGMAFKDLYRAAREGFLVSSDLALRAQLTEFIDHKLVKTKRNADGVENLLIPLSNGLLKKFLEERES